MLLKCLTHKGRMLYVWHIVQSEVTVGDLMVLIALSFKTQKMCEKKVGLRLYDMPEADCQTLRQAWTALFNMGWP